MEALNIFKETPIIHSATCERSNLMPFGRLLKVGGKSVNIANSIVEPLAVVPAVDTTKRFVIADGVLVGLKLKWTCVQVVLDR